VRAEDVIAVHVHDSTGFCDGHSVSLASDRRGVTVELEGKPLSRPDARHDEVRDALSHASCIRASGAVLVVGDVVAPGDNPAADVLNEPVGGSRA
jgi:hypothetical protein